MGVTQRETTKQVLFGDHEGQIHANSDTEKFHWYQHDSEM